MSALNGNPLWNIYRFNWVISAIAIAVLTLGLALTKFHFRLTSLLIVATAAGLYGVCGYLNAASPTRCNPRIALPLTATAQIIVLLSTLTSLTYLATSANLPLVDADLQRIDTALGWDFRAYLAFINDRPWLLTLLVSAYTLIGVQLLIITIFLPLAGFYRRAGEFISAFAIALVITTCVSTVLPAVGAYGMFGISPEELHLIVPHAYYNGMLKAFPALRDGSLRELDCLNLEGVLTFPSFHAAAAVLYIWAFWAMRWLRPLNVLINGAMFVATPAGGGHYLIDVLAGIAVALVSIYFAGRIADVCEKPSRAAKQAAARLAPSAQ